MIARDLDGLTLRNKIRAAVAYVGAIVACVAAPILGFVFNARGKSGAGLAVAWLPVAGALVALAIPAPY